MSGSVMSKYRNMSHLQKHFDRLMVASKSVLEIHTKAPIKKDVRNLCSEINNRYKRLKECIENIEKMVENP